MSKSFFLSLTFCLPIILLAQPTTVIEGKLQLTEVLDGESSSSLVVRLEDGTLAQRNATDLIPALSVSFEGDTLYQGGDNWIIIPGISAANKATYRVTFDAEWSVGTHPNSFPSSPHFSGLIGMTHSNNAALFQTDSIASVGIKNMAEFGSNSVLLTEINTKIVSNGAQSVISGGGISRSPGSVGISFALGKSHSMVSLVSMVAPSPDWFIGVRDIELYENGTWVSSKTVPVNIYDAGTDSGNSYTSANQVTIPQVPIFMITSSPLGTNGVVPIMGTMTFERIDN